MGREIRRVPPNWDHPKKDEYDTLLGRYAPRYRPLYDEPYVEAIAEWITNHLLWQEGRHPDQISGAGKDCENYADWNGNAPDVERYRPNWTKGEMTWWQVYETVSEGTPVTPPFETREKLVEYLVANGDFWDQSRRERGESMMNCDPWSRKAAERFVFGSGWAPSFIGNESGIMSGVEAMAEVAEAAQGIVGEVPSSGPERSAEPDSPVPNGDAPK